MIKTQEGEKIILEARRHWFVVFPHALVSGLLAVAPPILYVILKNFTDFDFNLGGNFLALAFFAYAVWLLALWIFFFVAWTEFYLDVWYITNKRIIDVEQKGIFHREIIGLRYEQIQNVTVEVRGLIATLLNFGDVHVQTAATDRRKIKLRSASDPQKLKKLILAMQGQVNEKMSTVKLDTSNLPPEISGKIV